MKELLKELMKKSKNKGEPLDENYKNAKMGILDELRSDMDSIGNEDLKKVTVTSNDKEGLKKGLEKAGDVLEELPSEELEGDAETKKPALEDLSIEELEELLKNKRMEMSDDSDEDEEA